MKSIVVCCCLLGFCTGAFASDPEPKETDGKSPAKKNKPKFTIGKETTFVDGPVDKDGFIDFAAALNERLGKGVTAENNANVLIWKALGPRPNGKAVPPEFFKMMGIEEPAEKGDYFVRLDQFVKDRSFQMMDRVEHTFGHSWTAKEFPELAAWLRANEKPMSIVIEASKRPHYFAPCGFRESKKGRTTLNNSFIDNSDRRVLLRLLNCRAMLDTGEGRFDAAWQDLLAFHRLARLIGRGGGLLDSIEGYGYESQVRKVELVFLEQPKFDGKQFQQCLNDLQKLPSLPSVADIVDLAERLSILESALTASEEGISHIEFALSLEEIFADGGQFQKSLEGLVDKKKLNPEKLGKVLDNVIETANKKTDPVVVALLKDVDWDPILRDSNNLCDRMAAALRDPDRQKREKVFASIEDDRQKLKKQLPGAAEMTRALLNAETEHAAKAKLIRVMFEFASPARTVHVTQGAADRAEQGQRNLHIAFALAAYQRDHKGYPKTLDELSPKYLAKVPDDLFTGKPLTYRPNENGYLLYSFGPNGKDDGGRANFDNPQGDDISVRMPIPDLPKK